MSVVRDQRRGPDAVLVLLSRVQERARRAEAPR
jgi:hypothetical protein